MAIPGFDRPFRAGDRAAALVSCDKNHNVFAPGVIVATDEGLAIDLDQTLGTFCPECGEKLTRYAVVPSDENIRSRS